MTIPKLPEWCTNTNHPAGGDPWSGQPNKVEPSAGKIATGRIPEELPPAEETNWYRNQIAEWINYIAGWRLSHWSLSVCSSLVNLGETNSICWDPVNRLFTCVVWDRSLGGANDISVYYSPSLGHSWYNEFSFGFLPATIGQSADVAASEVSGTRILVAASISAANNVFRSTSLGAWAGVVAGSGTQRWSRVCWGPGPGSLGTFIVLDSISGSAYYSTNDGVSWSALGAFPDTVGLLRVCPVRAATMGLG